MSKKHLLVEYLNDLNTYIYAPLQATQRIKYTSIDISSKYALFGATSGGIYVFTRHPCKFLKLVPSKEGAITRLSISPDEKTIAACTPKGLILVFQNCLIESYVKPKVFTEAEGHIITEMKWHDNLLYCGDNLGKLYLVTFKISLAAALFQPSCTSIMSLESSIVQIDAFNKYLVVSTKTRSVLVDTSGCQFVQIGKKLRDGNYGACFFDPNYFQNKRSLDSNITSSLNEELTSDQLGDIKIFCCRPGCRLWEANMSPTVVCTHQFKNSAMQFPSTIINMDQEEDHRLNLKDISEADYVSPEKISFEKIYVFHNKFLLTFNSEGFYILDINQVTVLFWSNKFKNIRDIKVFRNNIYIWHNSNKLNSICLYELESLILETLFHKKYNICSELCIHYMPDVLNLVDTTEKIRLVVFLKNKLIEMGNNEFLGKLQPVFEKIENFKETRSISPSRKAGILVVENMYTLDKEKKEEEYNELEEFPETIQAIIDIGSTMTETIKEKFQILHDTVRNFAADESSHKEVQMEETDKGVETIDSVMIPAIEELLKINENLPEKNIEIEIDPIQDKKDAINTLYKYYLLCKNNSNLEIQKLNEFFSKININDAIEILDEFIEYVVTVDVNDLNETKIWCYKQYLRYLCSIDSELEISKLKVDSKSFQFLTNALVTLNNESASCKCSFPLPNARQCVPQFYNIGCVLVKKLYTSEISHDELLIAIPYLWRYVIHNFLTEQNISISLPVIVQFSDLEIFHKFHTKFNNDVWEDSLKLYIKLRSGKCLNCDKNIALVNNSVIPWTDFGMLLVKALGGGAAVKLLMRYSKHIPSSELTPSFYQSCILLEGLNVCDEHTRNSGVQFIKSVNSTNDTSIKWDSLMTFYLRKKQLVTMATDKGSILTLPNCTNCDLPLNTPVMSNFSRVNCGHYYHNFCISSLLKNYCKVCHIYVTIPDKM